MRHTLNHCSLHASYHKFKAAAVAWGVTHAENNGLGYDTCREQWLKSTAKETHHLVAVAGRVVIQVGECQLHGCDVQHIGVKLLAPSGIGGCVCDYTHG